MMIMGIFDVFKKREEIYYRDFKKAIMESSEDKKISIMSLQIRVMTISRMIEIQTNETKTFTETSTKNNSYRIDDSNLRIKVMLKLLNEAEQDFIQGVRIKLRDEVDEKTLINYERCKNISNRIGREYWNKHRYIESEEVQGCEKLMNFK